MTSAGEENRNTSEQAAEVDNTGATYQNEGDVYNAPVNHQTIVDDDSTTYKVEKEEIPIVELLSKLVIGTLGETKTIASSVVAVVAGVGSLLIPSYAPPSLSESVSPASTYVGMILILFAAALFVALRYKRARDCSECGAEYALEEIGHPEAREVPTEDGIRKTVTRQYRCTECSHETSRTKNELMQESS